MSELPYAESFRDLVVYQKSQKLSLEIYHITKTFPREEMFSLTDQIRKSSRSIGAQIAEAWAKRRYEKHFISKLADADGERQETIHITSILQTATRKNQRIPEPLFCRFNRKRIDKRLEY